MPANIALIYGQAIQAIKRRHAEDLFLSPLGLNTDTFLAQQRDLSEGFVDRLAGQLQDFKGSDVEALLVGGDGENAHIWEIDRGGVVTCLDDIGFGAIGSGSWHARSRLMQLGYTNMVTFGPAVLAAFASKRAAEVAPGVGTTTDIHIVFKDRIEPLRQDMYKKCDELYEVFRKERLALEIKAISDMEEFLATIGGNPTESVT